MSDGRGSYITGPQMWSWQNGGGAQPQPGPGYNMPSQGPAGPPSGQFLGTFQQLVQAVNQQANAIGGLHGLSPTIFPQMQLNPEPAPAAPSTGAIIYVDSTTNNLMVVKADGTRTRLA